MAPFANRIIGHAVRALKEELQESKSPVTQELGKHLDQCSIPECGKFSPGAVCGTCSRFACRDHARLTLTVPPRIECVECVALEVDIERNPR